jgi:hypothetical protein
MNQTHQRRKPWSGETPALPSRVDGLRIVAAVKNATTTAPAHQWVVVLENAGETWTVGRLVYVGSHTGFDLRDREVHEFYQAAIVCMVGRVVI